MATVLTLIGILTVRAILTTQKLIQRAIHVPEPEIEQQEPNAPFAQDREAVGAGVGRDHVVPAPPQELGQEGRDLGLVVQDQDAFWIHWGCLYGSPKAFLVLQS